jgi:hypothetical protein
VPERPAAFILVAFHDLPATPVVSIPQSGILSPREAGHARALKVVRDSMACVITRRNTMRDHGRSAMPSLK